MRGCLCLPSLFTAVTSTCNTRLCKHEAAPQLIKRTTQGARGSSRNGEERGRGAKGKRSSRPRCFSQRRKIDTVSNFFPPIKTHHVCSHHLGSVQRQARDPSHLSPAPLVLALSLSQRGRQREFGSFFFLYAVSIVLHSLCGSGTAGQMAVKCPKRHQRGKRRQELVAGLTKSPACSGSAPVVTGEANGPVGGPVPNYCLRRRDRVNGESTNLRHVDSVCIYVAGGFVSSTLVRICKRQGNRSKHIKKKIKKTRA